MTPAERLFADWFGGRDPGPYCYFRGHLAKFLPDQRPPVADLVLRLATGNPRQFREPVLHIAQKRHGDDDYSYMAWRIRA